MITAEYNKESKYINQRIRYRTLLFGKYYFWMSDVDDTWYLLGEDEKGEPTFA